MEQPTKDNVQEPLNNSENNSTNLSAAIVKKDGNLVGNVTSTQGVTIVSLIDGSSTVSVANDIIEVSSVIEKDPCVICYEKLQSPIILPCDHEFCYQCLKTTLVFGNYKCPQCRCIVPDNFLEKAIAAKSTSTFIIDDGVKWMYSGRQNGWWFYENSHNQIIEEAYQKMQNWDDEMTTFTNLKPHSIKIEILSVNYIIDFVRNLQINPLTLAIRLIKRVMVADFKSSKGVGGLKYLNDDQVPKYDKVYPSTNDVGNFNPNYANSYLNDDTSSEDI